MSSEHVEETSHNDGSIIGKWIHDENHGPWQVTAPVWAVREFTSITEMMVNGRWRPPVVVGDMGEGHLIHCDGIWDHERLVVEPMRDVYYEATVTWSNGTVGPICLWNGTGIH